MEPLYESLVKRIYAKCQQEEWFGTQLDKGLERSKHDPARYAFLFPPATTEQLQETEQQLGFPLPPFLRYLYKHVANGGFGPGGGLRGVLGGFGYQAALYEDDTIIGYYRFLSKRKIVDINSHFFQNSSAGRLELPDDVWPKQLIPLGDMGCVQEACVTAQNQMFLYAAVQDPDRYGLARLGCSFEQWIERWLNNQSTTYYDNGESIIW